MSACLTSAVCADPNCGGNPLASTQPPPCIKVINIAANQAVAYDANGRAYPEDEGRIVGTEAWWDLVISRSVNNGGLREAAPVAAGSLAAQ